MSEKNMGRKFKVGDKVKLTKAGEEADFFNPKFREGDTAEVLKVNMFDDSIWSIIVTSGDDSGHKQDNNHAIVTDTWFEHVDTKKEHKKKRKYFCMGDFVTLKDGVSVASVTSFSLFSSGMVGIIVGEEYSGAVTVRFVNNKKYDFETVSASALRLATKEECKTLRKHKVAKITYDNTSEIEQNTEASEEKVKIPPEYDVKVGDIVEITEDINGHSVGTIGEVVLVAQENNAWVYNHVEVRGNNGECWIERNVKLVYRKPETESK